MLLIWRCHYDIMNKKDLVITGSDYCYKRKLGRFLFITVAAKCVSRFGQKLINEHHQHDAKVVTLHECMLRSKGLGTYVVCFKNIFIKYLN